MNAERRKLIAERHQQFLEWRKEDKLFQDLSDNEAEGIFDLAVRSMTENRRLHRGDEEILN
jgi:hypothetical protein